MWVLDHLPDLESDFSAFHRIDNIYELPGPRFFEMAYRLSAYGGVVSALSMQSGRSTASAAAAEPPPMPLLPHGTDPSKVVVVPPTAAGIASSDLAGLFSWGQG